jgi:ADP-ribosylglycohydrolase
MQYRSEYECYHRTQYGYVHIFPCLAAALIGFHYGKEDFGRSMAIATMCGGDTDFPPALVGTVLGIWLGEPSIPDKWCTPLGDTFETMAKGMEHLSFDEVARRICAQGRRLVETGE